ncbi:MAG: glycosyltransferase [Patescibacteria group bacterium]
MTNVKHPTVTIAMCALNEEANIGQLLTSIFDQETDGFVLEKILLISDGSTDKTVEIARTFKSRLFEIKDYKERKGKSFRLNEIYTGVKSDIVVQPDADVILKSKHVIKDLIAPYATDKSIGMTGGNALPLPAETFVERAVNLTLAAYIPFKKTINNGNNILSATGRLLSLRREVFQNITVPQDTIANDGFVYFCTLTQGFKYRFVETAEVFFRSPQTLHDQISQNTRFSATHTWMKKYFPPEMVDHEYNIPASELSRAMLVQFIKHPVLGGYIFLINRYCRLRSWFLKKRINAIWEVVYSTKSLRK